MLKKTSVILILIVTAAGFLAATGCSSMHTPGNAFQPDVQTSGGGNILPEEDEKITLRILTRLSSNQPNAVAFRGRVQEFLKENPGITIDDQSIEDEASYDSRFKTAVASGDMPEMFSSYGGRSFEPYCKSGVAADLTDILNSDREWSDAFLPVFENWQFDHLKGTYAVPYEFYAIGIFYNKALFKKINANPPRTISEFETVCEKFKAVGIIPMALGEKDPWRGGHLFCNLLDKRFGAVKNAELANRSARYDDEDMLELFELMQGWQRKGYFGDRIVNIDFTTEKEMFHSGRTAMHMDGSWYVPEAGNTAIKADIGFIPFPYFDERPENKDIWMGGAGGAFSITGQTSGEKKAAAVKLLKFVTSPEAFEYYRRIQKGGVFPVKLLPDPEFEDALTLEYSSAIKEAVFKAEVYSSDPLPQLVNVVRSSLQEMFAGQSPERAAAGIAQTIDKNR